MNERLFYECFSPSDYHQYEERIRNLEYENRELRAEVRRSCVDSKESNY